MVDWIRFVQRVAGKLTGRRELFAFRAEYWGAHGIEPDPLRQRQTALGRRFGTRLFSRAYPGLPGRVHVHESMLQNDLPEELAHYAQVGRSAIDNIEAALKAAGRSWGDIHSLLDMACGYGRVLRLLAQKVDPRTITACELDEEAVRFCAEEFGVRPLVSQKNLRQVAFPGRYDLIWIGSLLTNLTPDSGLELLDVTAGLLNPGGLLVFSTQGESCLAQIPFYGFMFAPREALFREQMAATGIAYSNYYPHTPDYGITLHRRDRLEAILAERFGPALRPVYFKERGWDEHQDVYGYQKA